MAESRAGNRRPRSGRRRLRYPGRCAVCGVALERGSEALWNAEPGTVTCLSCAKGVSVDGAETGTAGESARAEGERRRRVQRGQTTERVGDRRPWARVLRGRLPEPDTGVAWATGAAGEERLGKLLDKLAQNGGVAVLHDRALPRSRANLDHLVVTAAGVWVVDAKNYRGRIEVTGGRIVVEGRDRTDKLVAGAHRQSAHVRGALDPTYRDVPVHVALCFVDAKRRLAGKAHTVDGVLVTSEKALLERLRRAGQYDERWRSAIQRHLATRFGPAAGPSQ